MTCCTSYVSISIVIKLESTTPFTKLDYILLILPLILFLGTILISFEYLKEGIAYFLF